jgi:pyruvate,water dikinase
LLLAPWRILVFAQRYDPGRWTEDPRFTAFLARIDELAGQEQAAMTWSQLMTMPRRALALITPIRDLRGDYLPGTGLALLRLRLALQVLGRSPLFADLLTGSRTRTSDANRALEALADRARADPQLAAAVASLDPEVLTGFPDFGAEFGAYLAEYGHRETVSPVLVTTPTQVDSPEAVLGLVAVLAAEPPRPDGRPSDAAAELLAHPLLRGRRRRGVVEGWVRAARAGVVFREDSHFYFLKPLPILRRSLLEIGRRLRDAGVLADPEDVFHLRLEELEAVRDPAAAAESGQLAAAVRSRSGRRQELAGVRLIDPAAVFPAQPTGEALVSGTAASSGTATGPVKVIRGPAEFAGLAAGDVLVCPYTNPAWTPLFQRAAAVVVDSGGVASHAAIVAREYGIPAVMGTGTATSVLTDGQRVVVDGTRGLVTAAPPEDPQR